MPETPEHKIRSTSSGLSGRNHRNRQLLTTIPLKGNDFIRQIKQRLDIHLLEVTHTNRDRLPEAIVVCL
jgi:nucleoside-triphosphatase THEP1